MKFESMEWRETPDGQVPVISFVPNQELGAFILRRSDGEKYPGLAGKIYGVSKDDAERFQNGDVEALDSYLDPTNLPFSIFEITGEEVRVALIKEDGSEFSSRNGGILKEYKAVKRQPRSPTP